MTTHNIHINQYGYPDRDLLDTNWQDIFKDIHNSGKYLEQSYLPKYNQYGEVVQQRKIKLSQFKYYTQEKLARAITAHYMKDPKRDLLLQIIRITFEHTNILLESSNIFTEVTNAIRLDEEDWYINQWIINHNYIHILYYRFIANNRTLKNRAHHFIEGNKENIYQHFNNIFRWYMTHPHYNKTYDNIRILW